MADLYFVDFALIPSPVRKETQFKLPELPDDFSRIEFYYSLTDEPFRVRFSRAFSSFHIAGRPLFGDPYLKWLNYPDLNIQIGGKPTIRMSKNTKIYIYIYTRSE